MFKRFMIASLAIGVLAAGFVLMVAADGLLPKEVRAFHRLGAQWSALRESSDASAHSFRTETFILTPFVEWATGTVQKTTGAARSELEIGDDLLELARSCPNSAVGVAANQVVAAWSKDAHQQEQAATALADRVRETDLKFVRQAIERFRCPHVPEMMPALLTRLTKNLNHPDTPFLLSYVCTRTGGGSESLDPPREFVVAADLISEHFAASSDIHGFCQALGDATYSPTWAPKFEPHLQKILSVNKDRWVRCSAMLAVADSIRVLPERQQDALSRYQRFLDEFDGKTKYQYSSMEDYLRHSAQFQLDAMKFAPTFQPAPEIEGVDLAGKSIKLSDYRGRVVLLSFWATWCKPCMNMVRHERELQRKFQGEPFSIIGVNADEQIDHARDAVEELGVTWSSFQDKQPNRPAISESWKALFPTVYLIDAQGVIRKRFTGNPQPEVIEQSLRELFTAAKRAK